MMIYGAYEDDEFEQCRYIGTVKELAKELNVTENAIRRAVSINKKIHRKYKIIKLYKEKVEG